jgi:hypothetical protein
MGGEYLEYVLVLDEEIHEEEWDADHIQHDASNAQRQPSLPLRVVAIERRLLLQYPLSLTQKTCRWRDDY